MTESFLARRPCVLGLLIMLASCSALAECHAPRFRVGQDFGATVFVAVNTRDLGIDKLVCLARALFDRRSAPPNFSVVYCTSDNAARYFQGRPVEGTPPGWEKWARHVHAIYTRDTEKHSETMLISPLGFKTPPTLLTTIEVSGQGERACRGEIANRCLLAALEEITYPEDALMAGQSETIHITGVIGAGGAVSNLRVARPNSRLKKHLARIALRDLKTWRFDPTTRTDPFEMSYVFEAKGHLPHGTPPYLELTPPDRVSVRGSSR
jgi:hypothetical protein